MGLEPAFSRHSWPVSDLMALPLEPDDPRLGIPRDALELNHRDKPDAVVLRASGLELEATAGAPLVAAVKTLPLARKWKLALVASCVFHVAVAAFFMARGNEPVLIEGAQETGSVVLGNAAQDDRAAGEPLESELNVAQVTLLTMIEATPIETVDAREVENDALAEAATTETLEPVEEAPVAPPAAGPVETVTAQAAPQVMPDRSPPATAEPQTPVATSEFVPEVLTAERNDPDENTVVQPQDEVSPSSPSETTKAETAQPTETIPATPMEAEAVEPVAEAQTASPPETVTETPVEVQPAEATADAQPSEAPDEVQPVETPETITAEMVPTPRPEAAREKPEPKAAEKPKQPEKRQEERKAAPKKVQPQAAEKPAKPKETRTAAKGENKAQRRAQKGGNGGKGKANAAKGVTNGRQDGTGLNKGKGGKSGSGNAAVSNYPGKVTAKLRRAARGISRSVRRQAKNDVQVGFTISAGGGVSGVRITRSSGSPELDQMALAVVRRAAPFPPIPEGAGRSSWPFAMPLGF